MERLPTPVSWSGEFHELYSPWGRKELDMTERLWLTFPFYSQFIQWHPTPVLLPGKSHGRRSLVGCSPWGDEESDMTERLHFHFSLSCIGEGNGNPLQCSCLENPRDGEPGGLPFMGSHRVGHDWSDLAAAAAAVISKSDFFIKNIFWK